MNEILATTKELETGKLRPKSREEGLRALREDGYTVLRNAVATEHLELLREKMLADAAVVAAQKDLPLQFIHGHIQQDPPPFAPYLFRDVLLNDLVIELTSAVLGAGMRNVFYSGNTNLPGSPCQPVRFDSGQLWSDLQVAPPAHQLVINIPVVNTSAHNGSIELWPGTHTETRLYQDDSDIKVGEEFVEARRAISPPFQPEIEVGSVLIRDMRLWHRGMPNHSEQPRPMIAMIHVTNWWRGWPATKIDFGRSAEGFLMHPKLITDAAYHDEPVDYLNRHKAYDVVETG